MIPELIDNLHYQKGPCYADQGDFSSAGVVSMGYANKLPVGIANFSARQQGFMRGLIAKSHEIGSGEFLYAFELYSS